MRFDPKRRALTAALAAVALSALAACGSDGAGSAAGPGAGTGADGGASELRPVTLVLDWTPNTNHSGIYLARERGYFADEGLDVTIIEPGENGADAQLMAGNAEFAVSVAENVLPARAAGAPVVSIAAILASNTSSLLAPADRGIERPRDLENHTYGGFGGPLETALVSKLIECDGGDPSTITFAEVGNVDYRVGFDRGDYDFVWIFDGWDGIRLDQEGLATTTIPFAEHLDCIPDWYTPLLATTEQVIADKPDVVRSFLAATAHGYRDAIDDPGAAADALLKAAPELDADLVEASAEWLATRYAADPATWGRQDGDVWTRFAAFLDDAGMLDSRVDAADAFTDDYLPES